MIHTMYDDYIVLGFFYGFFTSSSEKSKYDQWEQLFAKSVFNPVQTFCDMSHLSHKNDNGSLSPGHKNCTRDCQQKMLPFFLIGYNVGVFTTIKVVELTRQKLETENRNDQ